MEQFDLDMIRHAYLTAGSNKQRLAFADATGRGLHKPDDRRQRDESEPPALVTQAMSKIACDPRLRQQFAKGGTITSDEARGRAGRFQVQWKDGDDPATAIVAKLLRDPELADAVYRLFEAERVRTARAKRRRSEASSDDAGPSLQAVR